MGPNLAAFIADERPCKRAQVSSDRLASPLPATERIARVVRTLATG
jgi:hypothetical protein